MAKCNMIYLPASNSRLYGCVLYVSFYSGPPRGEEAPIEKYLFQCESLDGQSTTIGAPFSIKYYERGHKDKLVELLEKKLLEESQQPKP